MKAIIPIAILALIGSVIILLGSQDLKMSNTNTNNTVETCIITINGERYDITEFQNLHEGGNIFKCGTDMTTDFQNQHGNDLERINPYKIN